MDFKSYLNEKREIIEESLKKYSPEPRGPAADVIKAMNYSLFAGGKRLRPILCMAGAEAVGGEGKDVIPVACALELIHTYSLIHDDLPVMDNDDIRRGKPTSHKVFGEAVAILAGDGLLTEAFRLMTETVLTDRLSPGALLNVIAMIATAAGYDGMVGGQVVDIRMEGKSVDDDTVEFIHRHKTGALITASVCAGATLGGGDEHHLKFLTSYGKNIGLAFQISDDILDIEGDSRQLGKNVGGDARKKKITYPGVLGLGRSKEIQEKMIKMAIESLESFDHRADALRHIAQYIIERKR